jgi:hypothetical protein
VLENMPRALTGKVEIRDIVPGLWIWRAEHHHWKAGDDWQPVVTSTFVESGGERYVVDSLVPTAPSPELWKRLDNRPPTIAVVLMPDHVRDIDEMVLRYPKVRPMGPLLFFPDDIPKTPLKPIRFDTTLPGGVVALYDGRGRLETPLWLPEQRVILFGDALTERDGELRVWDSPSHEKRELPALREMLALPFEKVIISHADTDPVQSRASFEQALKRPPFRG